MTNADRIKKWLDEHHISYDTCGKQFIIKACSVGDNFYDYGEESKEIIFDEECKWMEDNPSIIIRECCDCFGCGGW